MKAFRILFALALLLPLRALHAQIEERTLMSVNIPFAFIVDNTRLPAGRYVIYAELGHEWKVASVHGKGSTFFHITPDETPSLPAQSRLIFHRYETEYVLHQIDDGGTKIQAMLSTGDKERQLARKAPQPELAMINAQPGLHRE